MTIPLTRRSVKGSRLDAVDHDTNLDALESAIEARLQTPEDVVHITNYNNDLWAAIDATPTGGVLLLDNARYVGLPARGYTTKNRDDITIIGAQTPRYADDGNSLVDGTIIEGGLQFIGSNIRIEKIGVDCGPTWLTQPGSQQVNCFTFVNQAGGEYNLKIKDCIALSDSFDSPYHCYVVVGYDGVEIEQIKARGALWGLVLKSKRTRVDGLDTINVGRSGFHVKSDDLYSVEDIIASNIQVISEGLEFQTSGNGIYILTSGSNVDTVSISNAHVKGYNTGFSCTATQGFRIRDVNLNNANIEGSTNTGLAVRGDSGLEGNVGIRLSNVGVRTASGKGAEIKSASAQIVNLDVNMPTFDAEGVEIEGGYQAQNVISSYGVSAIPNGLATKPDDLVGGGQLGLYRGILTNTPTTADADAILWAQKIEQADQLLLPRAIKVLMSDHVAALKDQNLWSSIQRSAYFFLGQTLAGALRSMKGTDPVGVNLVSGDFNRATGIKGDGSSKNIRLECLANDTAQDSVHLLADFTENPTVDNIAALGYGLGGDGALNIIWRNNPRWQYRGRVNTVATGTTGTTTGIAGINRASSTTYTPYRNGVAEAEQTVTSQTPAANAPLYLLGSSAIIFSNARARWYSYGDSLNVPTYITLVQSFRDAVLALI